MNSPVRSGDESPHAKSSEVAPLVYFFAGKRSTVTE